MHAHDTRGTHKPLPPVPDINEATEPDHAAEAAATFESFKATPVNEPAQKQKPTQTAKATSKPAGRANATVAEQVVNAIKPLLEKNQTQEIDLDAEAAARFDSVAKGEPAPDATAARPEAPAQDDPDAIPDELLNPNSTDELLSAEPPEGLSEKAKADWKILRDLAITNKAESTTLSQQLAEAKQRDAEREAALRENQLADENYDPKIDEDALEKASRKAESEIVVFKTIPGNDLWNEGVARRKAEAAEFFRGQVSIEQAAEFAHHAVAGRELQKMLTNVIGKLKAANAQLARLKPAQATFGDAAGPPAPSNNGANWDDPSEAAARWDRASVGSGG